MDTPLLLYCILSGIIILLLILVRRERHGLEIENRIDALESLIQKLETDQRDEFSINRKENFEMSKVSRSELNDNLNGIKTMLAGSLQAANDNNQTAFKHIRESVTQQLETLGQKMDAQYHTNRLNLNMQINDFTGEQKTKWNEIKQEQKEFTQKVTEQLDKVRLNVERNLFQLNEQAKTDSSLMREGMVRSFREFQEVFSKNALSFTELQKERFSQLEIAQNKLIEGTEKKLDAMREIVEEKLQKTLSERLGQSFELVGKQLENVQKGLGEMQTLARDVGGLKRVLSNVKMRGGIGEVQLAMLLEQILAPEQYEANVKTKKNSTESVEFALKLPGRNDGQSVVWLPIDAKFPKEIYENLQTAYERGEVAAIETAQKQLEAAIKKMAKDIHSKYIDPPNTTDFGIMFLPFEGIYAEVVRKASLLEELQRNFKIIVTGPTTLAAILNSLQIGFRTLAIQKRSGEVWQVLAAVKKEFSLFGGMLEKAQRNIQTGLGQLDDVMGKRTRAIQNKLKNVETLEGERPLLVDDGSDR